MDVRNSLTGTPASPQAFPPNAEVDAIFTRWDNPDSPGCSLAVAKAGQIIYSQGYGMADLDHKIRNTPGTIFHAASLAKQFTAMSVLLLAHDLDEYAHQHIPELTRFTPKVTIRQMLHHTSGIRDLLALLTLAGWRLSDDLITRNDVLNLLGRVKTTDFAPPGRDWLYSNTNYFLAGEIVRVKSGDSLAEYARNNIFVPLGMTSTRFIEKHGEVVGNRAYGYYQPTKQDPFVMRMPSYDLTGPTNLLTTVEDLIRWDRNFDSGTVGGSTAIADMLKTVETPYGYDYGLGLMIPTDSTDGNVIEHNGRDPGHRSHLIRFRDQQLTVALLCNIQQDDISTFELVRDVADIFLGAPRAATPGNPGPLSTPAFRASNLEQYVGRYYSKEIDKSYDIKLEGQSLKVVREKYKPTPLEPVAKDEFMIKHFTSAAVSVLNAVNVRFQRHQGKINGFRVDDAAAFSRLQNFLFRKVP